MELLRALAMFAEPPVAGSAHVAEALELGPPPAESEYTETFLFQLYPYASVYLGEEGMMGGEARDRVAGFWRALGLLPPAEPDHLSVLLALYAELAGSEENEEKMRERYRHARTALLFEHLLSWLPVYLHKLCRIAPAFYRKWGETLKAALIEELETLGQPQQLPLHLRSAHGLVDPREQGAEEFLQSLLAPARSGMILTRADLMRCGRSLGLGLRMGERKFILRALFNQNPQGVLEWLLAELAEWRGHHHQSLTPLGAIAAAWLDKTEKASALLQELKSSAGDMEEKLG